MWAMIEKLRVLGAGEATRASLGALRGSTMAPDMDVKAFDHLPLDAFRAAAVGMALLDPDTARYLRVNPALARMLLREEAELLRLSHLDLTHPDDRAGYRERARQLIVNLLKRLGLSTVAEGVETEPQRLCLIDLGCELGQGFYLAPPMAAGELRRWLAAAGE